MIGRTTGQILKHLMKEKRIENLKATTVEMVIQGEGGGGEEGGVLAEGGEGETLREDLEGEEGEVLAEEGEEEEGNEVMEK